MTTAAVASVAQTAPNLFTEIRQENGKVELVVRNDHSAAAQAYQVSARYEDYGGRLPKHVATTGADSLLLWQKGLAPNESRTVVLAQVPISVQAGVIYADGLTAGSIELVSDILKTRREIRDTIPNQIQALRTFAGKSPSVNDLVRHFQQRSLPATLLEGPSAFFQVRWLVGRVLKEVSESGETLSITQTVDRVERNLTETARRL